MLQPPPIKHPLDGHLEPAGKGIADDEISAYTLSIAISLLKRITDYLTKPTEDAA